MSAVLMAGLGTLAQLSCSSGERKFAEGTGGGSSGPDAGLGARGGSSEGTGGGGAGGVSGGTGGGGAGAASGGTGGGGAGAASGSGTGGSAGGATIGQAIWDQSNWDDGSVFARDG